MKRLLSTMLLVTAVIFGSLGAPPTASAQSTTIDLDARLTVTPAYAGAIAEADYEVRSNGRRIFYAEVERLSSSMRGQRIDVFLNGAFIGSAVVDRDGEAEYRVDTSRGQAVPTAAVGDTVTLRHGSATIASGQFFNDGADNGGGSPPTPPPPPPSPTTVDLDARLTVTPAYAGAIAEADYEVRADGRRIFYAEVERLSSSMRGQRVDVFLNGAFIGSAVVDRDGEAEYRVDTSRGQAVPTAAVGDTVTLRHGSATIASGQFFNDGADDDDSDPGEAVKMSTRLTAAAAFRSVRGMAEYEVDRYGDRELEVKLNGARMLRGQTLTVIVNGEQVGTMRLNNGGSGRFEVDTDRGQFVPQVGNGTIVEVRFGNNLVASGGF